MNNRGVRTRGARRRAAQDESSTAQVLTLNVGVNPNENYPVVDNVSQEPKELVIEEVNLGPIDGAVSQALLRVLQ